MQTLRPLASVSSPAVYSLLSSRIFCSIAFVFERLHVCLKSAFVSPLLEQPEGLRTWKVFVTDTDPPERPGKLGRRYVFGWDGARFLGNREYEWWAAYSKQWESPEAPFS